jgi:hypothetical protein
MVASVAMVRQLVAVMGSSKAEAHPRPDTAVRIADDLWLVVVDATVAGAGDIASFGP